MYDIYDCPKDKGIRMTDIDRNKNVYKKAR